MLFSLLGVLLLLFLICSAPWCLSLRVITLEKLFGTLVIPFTAFGTAHNYFTFLLYLSGARSPPPGSKLFEDQNRVLLLNETPPSNPPPRNG